MTERSTRNQRVHPAAYGALSEALAAIYWYKRDLIQFIRRRATDHPALLTGLDFDAYKRVFADEFVDRLMADESRYRDLALGLMLEVAQMDSFPSLQRHADAQRLVPAAQEAVANVKLWVHRHQGVIEERETIMAEAAAQQATAEARHSFSTRLAALKGRFMDLGQMGNRQQAGLQFEPFLNELFHLFDLDPRLSYKLETEQIDGSLSFDTDDYILEAKWWKEPMEREHVDIFDQKVRRKGKNALGLYIAVNGFTAGALREYERRTAFITMDGSDLYCVLEGLISLDELLRSKKRYANETGNCYFPANLAL